MDGVLFPSPDDGVRQRLTARFGSGVETWLDQLPDVLPALAERWQIEYGALIPRGSMAVLFGCRVSDGRSAVMKLSPDRARLATEAAALAQWTTRHTPSVMAVDEEVGALLIDAIEPGTPLLEQPTFPAMDSIAELLGALHADSGSDVVYPPLASRVAYLFDSGTKPYQRRPELADLIPLELYERGRRLATRLAADTMPAVLLHGDLTPRNVLDGGAERGLVAIDPAPCLGDAAFDAIDLLLWQAGDVDSIRASAELFAVAIGVEADRLLDWCTAFAGMIALEFAESADAADDRIQTYLSLATRHKTY